MTGARRVHHERAGAVVTALVRLRAREHEDVLVAAMDVLRHGRARRVTQQRRRGAGVAAAMKAMDLDTFPEAPPGDRLRMSDHRRHIRNDERQLHRVRIPLRC
ncbi:hypothetical protein BE15_24325 [Sorangium cellulosum]|uniref:Uncharacterized protein n=1 Tax=Sorangium cellulosum TaxID=56 RepID=A0A150Q370_SORCE|nr:hypothetical protein BE15_24325 [Sorangium cellulosum]